MIRKSDFTSTLAILALAGGAAVTTLPAANGDIPIYRPTTITQPGHYIVTRDIASTGSSVITIGSTGVPAFSNVTLDLNGHALSTDNGNPVIDVNGTQFGKGLTIRNGRLQGSGAGTGHAIRGMGAGLEVRIEDLEIANFDGDGITFQPVGYVEVVRCRIRDIGGSGIALNSGSAPFGGAILDNTLERIQRGGMYLSGLQGGRVKGNVITQFGLQGASDSGIFLNGMPAQGEVGGTLIEGNTVTSNTGANLNTGILVYTNAHRTRVVGNAVSRNGAGGILAFSDHNRIERNLSSNNFYGIQVGDFTQGGARNHLEGNQTQGNIATGACGIRITNGFSHTYRNNIGGGNSVSGTACIPAGNVNLGGNAGL